MSSKNSNNMGPDSLDDQIKSTVIGFYASAALL